MVSSVIQFLQRVRVTATSAAALTSDIQAGIYKSAQKRVGCLLLCAQGSYISGS